jgi:hypothetical protein
MVDTNNICVCDLEPDELREEFGWAGAQRKCHNKEAREP